MEEKSMGEISFFWIFLIIVTCGFGAILYILLSNDGNKEGKKEEKRSNEVPSQQINPLKGLTDRQKSILEYLIEKRIAKPQELRKIAGNVSERTVRRDMTILVQRGLVFQEGTTKSTFYKYIGK
jgi:predicted HTH transcriptional regulator